MDFRNFKTGIMIVFVLVAVGCNEARQSRNELQKSGVMRELSASQTAPLESTPIVKPVEPKPEITQSENETIPVGEANLFESGGLALSELVVAQGIENRQPVQPGTKFKVDSFERIYAFLKVSNPSRTEDEVIVSWVPEGSEKERGTVRVSVGAQPEWRTWAFTRTVKKPGKYRVLVRNADEEIIAAAPFEISADEN